VLFTPNAEFESGVGMAEEFEATGSIVNVYASCEKIKKKLMVKDIRKIGSGAFA
jgi:hypothetical protein